MKFWRNVLVAVAILALVGMAQAQSAGSGEKKAGKADKAVKADKPSKAVKTLAGQVASVNVEKKELTLKTREKGVAKSVVVTVDEKTKIMVDGKAAKLGDLKAAHRVKVTPATGTAKKIVAKTAPEGNAPKAKEGGKKKADKK